MFYISHYFHSYYGSATLYFNEKGKYEFVSYSSNGERVSRIFNTKEYAHIVLSEDNWVLDVDCAA